MWFVLPMSMVKRKKDEKLALEVVCLFLLTYEAYGLVHQISQRTTLMQEVMPNQQQAQGHSDQTGIIIVGPVPICKGATFCEDISDYPGDLVSKAIERDPSLLNYVYVDAIDNISHKIELPDEEPLCLSVEKVVYPKSAENMDKQWLYVVNHENFTQSVLIETCVDEDCPCRMIDGFAEGYTTTCKQKYIYRQLSAIAADGTINRDFFRFPASCCCHVQFTGTDSVIV